MIYTDRPLDERIDTAIHTNPYLAGRKFQFKTDKDGVTIEGQVGTYFQKQMAQEILLRLEGVSRIDNRLKVG
jgi:osmotically-inducible protein OsmY